MAVASLEGALRASGYSTIAARNGAETLALVGGDIVDLLILGGDLPDMTLQTVLRAMRVRGGTTPVIVVAGDADAATILESGADDFMATPYNVDELLARIRARLRPAAPPALDTLTAGDLRLDRRSRRCTIGSRSVELTTREFDLVEVLMRHPNQVLTRDQLLAQVYGSRLDAASNVIDVYVGYLRRKLGADVIHTVRGIGYRLTP